MAYNISCTYGMRNTYTDINMFYAQIHIYIYKYNDLNYTSKVDFTPFRLNCQVLKVQIVFYQKRSIYPVSDYYYNKNQPIIALAWNFMHPGPNKIINKWHFALMCLCIVQK